MLAVGSRRRPSTCAHEAHNGIGAGVPASVAKPDNSSLAKGAHISSSGWSARRAAYRLFFCREWLSWR
jgi:hypothetical protein